MTVVGRVCWRSASRNLAPHQISTSLHAVEQFARHFKCWPDPLNQTRCRSSQAYLLREPKLRR